MYASLLQEKKIIFQDFREATALIGRNYFNNEEIIDNYFNLGGVLFKLLDMFRNFFRLFPLEIVSLSDRSFLNTACYGA